MNYKLIKLTKENDLNRELRKQKQEKGELSILFVSNWDEYSTNLLEKLEKKCASPKAGAKPLYIVDNYNMPHSFVIFKSVVLPQLVTIKKHRVFSEDYLPSVYRALDLE
tara:strand:- start:112 stop:438 length:327 start_codon:yes stop_codon:yes gene_type:complete